MLGKKHGGQGCTKLYLILILQFYVLLFLHVVDKLALGIRIFWLLDSLPQATTLRVIERTPNLRLMTSVLQRPNTSAFFLRLASDENFIQQSARCIVKVPPTPHLTYAALLFFYYSPTQISGIPHIGRAK